MSAMSEAGPSRLVMPGMSLGPIPIPTTPRPPPELRPFVDGRGDTLAIRTFGDEDTDLPGITRLCDEELSEPYNVYTFRYFLEEWPHITFLVYPSPEDTVPIATIICRLDSHRERTVRGYIGMLSVDKRWRRRGIARKLVEEAISQMEALGADEVVLETEYDNGPSLALYEALGFVREKRLHRFYSNGKDAFRLIRPMDRHPLRRTLAHRERMGAARAAQMLERAQAEKTNAAPLRLGDGQREERLAQIAEEKREIEGDGKGEAMKEGESDLRDEETASTKPIPPEIARLLAGPRATSPRTSQAAAQMDRLTLDNGHSRMPPPRPPVPSYIM